MLLFAVLSAPASGQEPKARIDAEGSRIEDFGADLRIELSLSRPVPWRVNTLDAPRRLVLDFDGVDLSESALRAIVASDCVSLLHAIPDAAGGWQRIVLTLTLPLRIETAGLTANDEGAVLKLQLAPTSAEAFSRAAAPEAEAIPTGELRLFTRLPP